MWPFKPKPEPEPYVPRYVIHIITKSGREVSYYKDNNHTEIIEDTIFVYDNEENEEVGRFPGYTGVHIKPEPRFYGW
jgi:hypothetical protein